MTTLNRLLASSLVLLCLVGAGCTNDEQQEAIDRNKRIEAQEAKDKADADAKAAEAAAAQTPASTAPAAESTPEPEQTPEVPAEPEKVNVYNVNGTTCECEERSQCGMSFWRCRNGKTYDCGTNTSYVATSVIKKDDYTDCNYESQN